MWTLTVTGPNKPVRVYRWTRESTMLGAMLLFWESWKRFGYTHWEVSCQWPVRFPDRECL